MYSTYGILVYPAHEHCIMHFAFAPISTLIRNKSLLHCVGRTLGCKSLNNKIFAVPFLAGVKNYVKDYTGMFGKKFF